jgi:MFS family permease
MISFAFINQAAGIILARIFQGVSSALLWAFQAVCYAAGDPAEQALVSDLTGMNQRGRAYGLYVMSVNLGVTLGPLGGAWLYQYYGAAMPFYANGVILGFCALVLLIFLKIPNNRRNNYQFT